MKKIEKIKKKMEKNETKPLKKKKNEPCAPELLSSPWPFPSNVLASSRRPHRARSPLGLSPDGAKKTLFFLTTAHVAGPKKVRVFWFKRWFFRAFWMKELCFTPRHSLLFGRLCLCDLMCFCFMWSLSNSQNQKRFRQAPAASASWCFAPSSTQRVT